MKKYQVIIFSVLVLLLISGSIYAILNKKEVKVPVSESSQSSISEATTTSQRTTNTTTAEATSSSSQEKTPEVDFAQIEAGYQAVAAAGFDSTLFNDEEIIKITQNSQKGNQTISDYLDSKVADNNGTDGFKLTEAQIDSKDRTGETEVLKAREELKKAGYSTDQMSIYDISELIKEATQKNKTVIEIAKEKKLSKGNSSN